MKLIVFASLLVITLVDRASCITNVEFFKLIKDNGETVIEEFYPDDKGFDDHDDAVELPGGPNDELDVENLIIQTGLPEKMMSQANAMSKTEPEVNRKLAWWRYVRKVIRHTKRAWGRRSRDSHRRYRIAESDVGEIYPCDESFDEPDGSSCHCFRYPFMVNLASKKIRFEPKICARVTYLSDVGVEVTLTMDGQNVFRKRISSRDPPGRCGGITGVKPFTNVCLDMYSVNIRRKSFCLRLEGRLNLLLKRFHVHLEIGCYRVGELSEKELTNMMNDTSALTNYLSNTDNPMIERSGDLFQADIDSLPKLMQHVEITEITDDDVTGDSNDTDDFVEQMEIEDFEN